MRSYYAHLETAMGKAPLQKPVYRSSAIFPVLNEKGISSRILFMGYWILKRNVQQIAAVVTLRTEDGKVIRRNPFTITEPKTYRIELRDELTRIGISAETAFTGSLEVEFFSTVPLVFPFPAVVVNYYGSQFSSVVHTAQRVYNDYDDMQNNSQNEVPESGFNVYADGDCEPFFGLINGPVAVPNAKIEMQFFNADHEMLSHQLELDELLPYQTKMIYPAQVVDLKKFLKGGVGAGKIRFHVNWIFPRLIVGNINRKLPAMSITHTYYDCSAAKSESDYWLPTQPKWHPAALMIPCVAKKGHFTNVYFYPIYSPAEFCIDVEIYDSSGKRLVTKQNALEIKSPINEYKKLFVSDLCKASGIDCQQDLSARIIGRSKNNGRFPARVKLGVDIGQEILPHMPCNICTNLQPFNPGMETKPATFRWLPALADQASSSLWIQNSSPAVSYEKAAQIQVTFYREKDSSTISRELFLPPNGCAVIRPTEDPGLVAFFNGQIGWCTAVSSNPYTTTYYFAENHSGVVGGDHGF